MFWSLKSGLNVTCWWSRLDRWIAKISTHKMYVAGGNFSAQNPTYISQSVQFSSFDQLCPTLCDPMNRSMPGLPVHHQLSEFTQTHVHWVGDAIQPSHPLSSPSPPAFNLQGPASGSFPVSQLFASGGWSTGVDCHFLLQGIFPIQESNPGLLQLKVDSLLAGLSGKPWRMNN